MNWQIPVLEVSCGAGLAGFSQEWSLYSRSPHCVVPCIRQGLRSKDLRANPPPGRLVDVEGHRLHIWCTGSGDPTVVLDAGLGGTAFDWGHVQPGVAEFTRVCSYDRAGMGYSDEGPRPRTSQQIVRELVTLLDGSAIDGRVVLVGGSYGGWNMRILTTAHDERVAGLVLVDARHEATGERFAAAGISENPPWVAWVARLAPVAAYVGIARLVGFSPGPPPDSMAPSVREFARATRFRSSAFASGADELESATESAEQVKSARRVLDIPLVVVSAGRRRSPQVADVLDSLQRDQLSLSKRSCQVMAARSGHGIVLQEPEIVVDAIRATVDASRQVAVAPDCGTIVERGS